MYTNIAFIILFLSTLHLPLTEKMYSKQYHENGNLKAEGWVHNDIKTNFWRFYHPNGEIASEGHFTDNTKSGYWQYYNNQGKIIKEGHYANGIAQNWWIFYDLATNSKQKIQYKNNKKNGFCLVYQGRKLQKVEKYENDVHNGSWTDIRSFKRDNPEVSLY